MAEENKKNQGYDHGHNKRCGVCDKQYCLCPERQSDGSWKPEKSTVKTIGEVIEKKKIGGPTKREQRNKNIGEGVTKKKEATVNKLKEAFAIGTTVEQACIYAEITMKTYYNWIEKDPELLHEIELLKESLPLKAKENIAKDIKSGDTALSKWLLERKESSSYGDTVRVMSDEAGESPQISAAKKLARGNYNKEVSQIYRDANKPTKIKTKK